MASGRSRGLPIFHDDLTFHDRHERAFEDMQRRFTDDFGFGRSFDRDPWNWRDDLDRMCSDFYKLKPRVGGASSLLSNNLDDFGSRDSLDDEKSSTKLYVEHPQTRSRTFHMSFDVRDYNPSDITVKSDGDTLIITARHEEEIGGRMNVREFSRRIKIPSDVDPDRLTSTLSHDGILTVHAPVPPKYTSVAYISPATGSRTTAQGSAGKGQQVPGGAQTLYQQQQQQQQQQQSPAPEACQPAETTTTTAAPPAAAPAPAPAAPPTRTGQQPTQTSEPPEGVPGNGTAAASRKIEPPPLFEHPTVPNLPLDTPSYRDSPDAGGGRIFELALEIPRPFTPDDVVVKLDGKLLKVEATHEEKSHGKTSSSSMSRSFDLTEDLDPGSVEAMLRSDGCLLIKGKVKSPT